VQVVVRNLVIEIDFAKVVNLTTPGGGYTTTQNLPWLFAGLPRTVDSSLVEIEGIRISLWLMSVHQLRLRRVWADQRLGV
jgi:hypothetical protein